MNDEERADWLARAIDDLLSRDRQRPTEPPPPELERDELNALMRIAGERIEAGQTRMQAGLQYEGEVWQGVLRKLDRRRRPRKAKRPNARPAVPPEDQFSLERDLEQFEIDELRDIAKMRRQLAEEAAAIAEAHRDDVWQKVQARLWNAASETSEAPRKRWSIFSWFKREEKRPAGRRASDLDPDESAEMEGLLGVAHTRRYWAHLAKKSAEERQERVWTGISRTIIRHKRDEQDKRNKREWWLRAAAVAAVAGLFVAAIGPLPATGFADHPFVEFGRTVAEHVGVRETSAPPAVPPGEPLTLAGRDATAEEASALLGAAVAVPPSPEGYALEASRYFKEAVTADTGGAFVVTFGGPEGANVAVFQELASGAEFTVPARSDVLVGPAVDVVLADGTAATYLQGAWRASDDIGALTWSESGGQTLVFERGGLRTTVQYTGPQETAPSLFALADSLAAPGQ